jgi:hypothetical protein
MDFTPSAVKRQNFFRREKRLLEFGFMAMMNASMN